MVSLRLVGNIIVVEKARGLFVFSLSKALISSDSSLTTSIGHIQLRFNNRILDGRAVISTLKGNVQGLVREATSSVDSISVSRLISCVHGSCTGRLLSYAGPCSKVIRTLIDLHRGNRLTTILSGGPSGTAGTVVGKLNVTRLFSCFYNSAGRIPLGPSPTSVSCIIGTVNFNNNGSSV